MASTTNELSGLQKAAILLITLGPERSSTIFKHLKEDYKDLQSKYYNILNENVELKRIFDEIENTSDSD